MKNKFSLMVGIFCLLVGLSYVIRMLNCGFTNSLAMWSCIEFALAFINLWIFKKSN